MADNNESTIACSAGFTLIFNCIFLNFTLLQSTYLNNFLEISNWTKSLTKQGNLIHASKPNSVVRCYFTTVDVTLQFTHVTSQSCTSQFTHVTSQSCTSKARLPRPAKLVQTVASSLTWDCSGNPPTWNNMALGSACEILVSALMEKLGVSKCNRQ